MHADRHTSRWVYTMFWTLTPLIIIYMNIAICIIAYNRIDSLKRVLVSLEQAYYDENVPLIISIDKSNSTIVEQFAKQYEWNFGEKTVIVHPENLGLRKHVLKCGELLKKFDALIVLEDDISVTPSYFNYAKQCIEQFYNNDIIAGISLYNFPINYINKLPFYPMQSDSDIYLMKCAQSWGQIWMKKQWNNFINWYEKNSEEFCEQDHLPKNICKWPKSSWLKYHTKYCIENNKYFVYPYISLSTNNSDKGTHVGKQNTLFQSYMLWGEKKKFKLDPLVKYDGFFENENIIKSFNIKENDICIDFYGDKHNKQNCKYWLSRKVMDYHIICSYALTYKPYELNIILNNYGQDIFLYDTSKPYKQKTKKEEQTDFYYLYKIIDIKSLIKKILNSYINIFIRKIK